MINEEVKEQSVKRLKRIEGQVKGIQRMIENEKYCIDIVNQVNAVRRALDQVALMVMKRHVESCVAEAIKVGNHTKKIDELMETINKFVK
ncbi:MAG: metal-sensitive transcriptional regulator [Thermodesulfobacteriota bacterium]